MLIAYIGDRAFVLPVAAVERIIPMAAPTILPQDLPGVMGVLNYQGTILAVVDPRPRFGISTPHVHPDQQLILIQDRGRYLLWVNRIERIIAVPVELSSTGTWPAVITIDHTTLPVLSPGAFNPGPLPGLAGRVIS